VLHDSLKLLEVGQKKADRNINTPLQAERRVGEEENKPKNTSIKP
jgi:hypothetical protein